MYLVTNAEMRKLDRYTIEEVGIPAVVLMENAGAGVARWAAELTPPGGRIVVVAGKGNNGGDGLVAARHLAGRGYRVEVLLSVSPDDLSGEAALQWRALRHWPAETHVDDGTSDWGELWRRADLIVDALLGTGLSRPVDASRARLIDGINASGRPVLSVDLPSGLDGDTGRVMGTAVKATWTLCLGLAKRGLVLGDGPRFAGTWRVEDIGLAPEGPERLGTDRVRLIEKEDVRDWLPERPYDAHKGTFGHLLVVAGRPHMWGAALMSGTAAYRAGTGLVTIALRGDQVPPWLGVHPELMADFWSDPAQATLLTKGKQALVVGPGLGRFEGDVLWLKQLLSQVEAAVVDAGALDVWKEAVSDGWRPAARVVLTPHPKEMARLTGLSTAEVQGDRIEVARRVAQTYGCVVVLKGAFTVVADPHERVWINPTGNPGMATGGTGDVLAGVIGGLLAQGLDPLQAAAAGVYLHGLAGDLAVQEMGAAALVATDLVNMLGAAIRRIVE
ncbi:MAG: NAD(P)H-hydrate dehydratase [Alicyclobacillaceae bacterium]|nr:NAD(P)H-hydrate dehydratase [Alicyclobacillaceae bacterium]